MTILFSDGMEFDTSGDLHVEHREDGWYVVGRGLLMPVSSREEGETAIAEMEGESQKGGE